MPYHRYPTNKVLIRTLRMPTKRRALFIEHWILTPAFSVFAGNLAVTIVRWTKSAPEHRHQGQSPMTYSPIQLKTVALTLKSH